MDTQMRGMIGSRDLGPLEPHPDDSVEGETDPQGVSQAVGKPPSHFQAQSRCDG